MYIDSLNCMVFEQNEIFHQCSVIQLTKQILFQVASSEVFASRWHVVKFSGDNSTTKRWATTYCQIIQRESSHRAVPPISV